MKVSIILPTYNEAGNIVALIREIVLNIPREWAHEIIVVDDNSPDGTYQMVRDAFSGDPAVVALLRTMDRGFARSIRAGIDAAQGDQIIVMDTDFTHDPVEIPRLLHVGVVYDIVSASRFCSGGNMQDVQHYIASMLYNWVLRILLRTQVQDNLGGYFTMRREKLMQLPLNDIFFGYGEYFFRLVRFAKCQGMTIVEVPALYRTRHAGKSKSNFLKMLFTYGMAALRLRRSCALRKEKTNGW
ncbi:MAG: glycosyltransferase [Candidatus Omnitrophica bacterium]|nr:glycosyltransferase [Candidatus Omnitrophota bacterium]